MMADDLGRGNRGSRPWKGVRWIPVIVIVVLLMWGKLAADVDETLVAALLSMLGWRFGSGGAIGEQPPGLRA